MAEYKLADCKPLFDMRDKLLSDLSKIEYGLRDVYGIVQNSDITVSTHDVKRFIATTEDIGDMLSEFANEVQDCSTEILEYIVSCKVTNV